MTNKEKDDLFYVCSLIEYIGRKTLNKRSAIVNVLGISGIKKQLEDAEVNHCLSFEQVSDEVIRDYNIENGEFDTISNCEYSVPYYLDIGKVYSRLIKNCNENEKIEKSIFSVFTSFISDKISDFRNGVYYQNPDYLKWSYKEGYLLD